MISQDSLALAFALQQQWIALIKQQGVQPGRFFMDERGVIIDRSALNDAPREKRCSKA
jgi:hypothetical protein